MKQILFILFAMVMITSCNQSGQVAGTSDEKKSDVNFHENIQTVYTAIETGDVSKLDTIIADDVVDHNANPDGSDVKGRDNIKKMLSEIHTYFEDGFKMELMSDAVSSDGQYGYALVRMKGKAKANPWGMPVGEEIDDTSVDVVKLRDGKATDHWGFMSMGDFNEIMKKMQGGMPPPSKDTTKK